jgi:Heterokaryon incompatibility protein (HET)
LAQTDVSEDSDADSDDLLWCDAVCINQNDLVERARQVSLMQRIYSEAKAVTVWLGKVDKHLIAAVAGGFKLG